MRYPRERSENPAVVGGGSPIRWNFEARFLN